MRECLRVLVCACVGVGVSVSVCVCVCVCVRSRQFPQFMKAEFSVKYFLLS